jgi:soluble lytic murein transglycosylase-like protein
MTNVRSWTRALRATSASIRVFMSDVGHGLLEVSHNSLALVGLVVLAAALMLTGRADLRAQLEQKAFGWLQDRHQARTVAATPAEESLRRALAEPDAILRATAADPAELDRQQAAIAQWISRRYKVAPEPVSRLVKEAWQVGKKASLEPTLILAIMAIESSFNPFAQSPVGAQGLMQVMTTIHDDKYEAFGGNHAAFDPVTNLRVGVQVLKECIARAGSLEGGLKFYVGAANLPDDGGYAAKVLAERDYLKQVAQGKAVPTMARLPVYVPQNRAAQAAQVDEGTQSTSAPAQAPADSDKTGAKPERVALAG